MGTRHSFHRVPRVAQVGTPILTLYAGPGTGKSTAAAMIFSKLKLRGENVELAHEVAKDYTWEGAHGKLAFQPLVTAKQLWAYQRLQGKVDLIITDTSPLYALIYSNNQVPSFRTWVLDDYLRRRHVNILLRRDPQRPYNPAGRRQSEESARHVDTRIEGLLTRHGIDHYEIHVREDGSHIDEIVAYVDNQVEWS